MVPLLAELEQPQLTITVLVLYDHVIVLRPGGIVTDDVRVVSENSVGIHLLQSQLSGGETEYNSELTE